MVESEKFKADEGMHMKEKTFHNNPFQTFDSGIPNKYNGSTCFLHLYRWPPFCENRATHIFPSFSMCELNTGFLG